MLNFSYKRNVVKTVLGCHFSPIKLAKVQKSDNMLHWQAVRETGIIIHCQGEFQNVIHPTEVNLATANKEIHEFTL